MISHLFHYFEAPIQSLWEDEQGTLWACTQGNGVIYYNPLTKQTRFFII